MTAARRMPALTAIVALLLSAATPAFQRDAAFDNLQPTVILVSFDGFRWDYPLKTPTPHLNQLMARGVRARNLIPSFPSKTFPNHYTIATGLYPGHHGIVANNIYDAPTGRTFAPARSAETRDPMWWGGVPIWTLVERAGKASAPVFWVGSEAPHDGLMPHYWQPYDENRPAVTRIEQALALLDQPAAQRPVFLTLYFEDTDTVGHQWGPDSEDVRAAITRVDAYLGVLMDGLTRRGIADRVNVVVVSDHGMSPVDDTRVVVVDDSLSSDDGLISDINPTLGVFPKMGKETAVYQALSHASPRLKVYRSDDLPKRWHLRGHSRVPPVFGVADEGWQVMRRTTFDAIAAGRTAGARGQHGYDPQVMSMRGVFVAAGPAFKRDVTVAPFENVSVYNVLARVLGVSPARNDGDASVVRRVLR